MDRLERMAEKVGILMKAECELLGQECLVHKQRSLVIPESGTYISCTLDLNISFTKFKEDGSALNEASIYLLPEELQKFEFNLIHYPLPLPIHYKQHVSAGPSILCFRMTSKEPPEHFAQRLSAALEGLEQVDGELYVN
ncbi:hypothetical protein B0H99_106207 [Planomicrobium soli]|uniref:Uncharacterized protein n=1 Tax=Planomicrobium soli TaxID=1176648 RepID=A0A2P8H1U8_9BACL|nr:hypothetical protein [Planomicrobium soli]PSL40188.1 hypothetical protein B0H99_106207 [Planomicrobium soli]